jgi:hypothetical protein
MKISALMEHHDLGNKQLLRESCEGLTHDQQLIVEGIYREFKPLIEASLTTDQISQLFGQIEKDATAAGGNRTMVGKGVDVAKKANEVIDNIGKWLQNTTPVKAFDQKFDDLKRKINTKFPDSKILDAVSEMGIWAQENPGKTAAIIGVLTAIASLAGGPIGGAIAGQVLRGSVELLKGEKLSTAIGKGVKTAAYGFIAGKTFELLGDAIKGGAQVVKDNLFPNALRLNMTQVFDEVGGELGNRWANFEIKGLVGRPEDINTAKKLFGEAGQYWKAGDYEQSAATWKSLEGLIADTFNDKEYIAQIASDQASRTMISQAAQAAQEATKYLGAAAQGAVTGAGVKGSLTRKESIQQQHRPLSEGQVYLVFSKLERLDEGPRDLLQKGVDWAKTKASNVTTKVTADKLSSAWRKAGSPTDSDQLAQFLEKQGVSTDLVKKTYATMKIPTPGAANTTAPQGLDYDSIVAMINKLPADRKARLLKYLTSGKGTQPATV